uniref:vacuolar protein sorting-associated protein 16 homolog isoform X2 n=1 Tax=Myxine glutinosa TaxID=7769 RepID=UPI00358E0183
MALVTADWSPMGDAFYRKTELYAMSWSSKFDISNHLVAAAPYGGPLALMQDISRHEKVSASVRPKVSIFTASGNEICSFLWKSGRVIHLAWSLAEDLLFVQDDGQVLTYDIFGSYKGTCTLGNEVKTTKAAEARTFSCLSHTGLAVMTSALRFMVTTNLSKHRAMNYPEPPALCAPPSCWAACYQDRRAILIVASAHDLFLLEPGNVTLVTPPGLSVPVNCYLDASVSFNGKLLALYTDSGHIWMGHTTLKEKIGEFETRNPMRPVQLEWCDNVDGSVPAVVAMWDEMLLVAGPKRDLQIQYPLDSPSYLVPEMDGVRVLNITAHDFLHRVPDSCVEVFRIGSMAPGALLLEASKEYEAGSQKADEYLREIREKSGLEHAVEQCITTAAYEYEPTTQKALLRAASFGKCFLQAYRPENFVEMCRTLRLLNALRDYTVGLPLSYTQLQQLTVTVLVDRLVQRRMFPLAIRVCELLHLPERQGRSRVLEHWACYKVMTMKAEDEERLPKLIHERLGDTTGISYEEVAARATDMGRTELAVRLLDYEARAEKQVPLLMRLKRWELALLKAIESGDTDLVYMVIVDLKGVLNQTDFYFTLRKYPVARNLQLKDLESQISALNDAATEFSKAKNDFAAKATEEQFRLLRQQKQHSQKLGLDLLHLSLHATILKLLRSGHVAIAERFVRDHRLPDRRWWWLKVEALAYLGDWQELEKFSKSKKSPIGYQPFVDACLKHGNRFEARKYIHKLPPEQKVKGCLATGELEMAIDTASERKSEDDLALILSRLPSSIEPRVNDKLEALRNQLGRR